MQSVKSHKNNAVSLEQYLFWILPANSRNHLAISPIEYILLSQFFQVYLRQQVFLISSKYSFFKRNRSCNNAIIFFCELYYFIWNIYSIAFLKQQIDFYALNYNVIGHKNQQERYEPSVNYIIVLRNRINLYIFT